MRPPKKRPHPFSKIRVISWMEKDRVPILWIRGEAVILDSDLAGLYGVETRRLNEQVRRNAHRFPADFMFQLTVEEKKGVVAKCDNPEKVLYFRGLPMVFTEHGALMASMVLNSQKANEMSLFIVRAFVGLRKEMSRGEAVLRRLAEIDQTLLVHDEGLKDLYQKLMPLLEPGPKSEKRKIGFEMTEVKTDKGSGFNRAMGASVAKQVRRED